MFNRIVSTVMTIGLVGLLLASGRNELSEKSEITVASKFDTEGALLGNMILLVLENGGFKVVDRTELGATDVVRKALETGEVDMYPEYTGNGNWFFAGNDFGRDWYDREKALAAVRQLDGEAFDIEWLEPARANNTWAIAVRRDLSESADLTSLSDFARYVNRGGVVKLAGSEEFVSRPDALAAFQEAYGFKLSENQLLVVSGGNTALTEKAAAQGTDGVNATMAYGTDGLLSALNLVVLEDNLGVQLVYEPAPRIRGEVLRANPKLADLLNPVFMRLDLSTLQTLNARIAVRGVAARTVAEDWLREEGFID